MTETVPELVWDPYDIEIDTAPYEIWRRMRDEAPVYYNAKHDFYALSRYDDVDGASRDPQTFSSTHGVTLDLLNQDEDMASMGSMIFMDPPAHDAMRVLVSRAFTPRRIAELEQKIRDICAEHLDPQIGGSGFDYLEDFGAQLPSKVISTLLGVPMADRPHLLDTINTMFHLDDASGGNNDTALNAIMEVLGYCDTALKERRANPTDDMFTALTQAEITDDSGDKRVLTDWEASNFALLLMTAGTETVARLLGNAAVLLGDHADQRALLVQDPSRIPNAVEELLRFEAPSPVQGRWTTRATELHGVTIPEHAKVLLITGSAGRDERVYPDPDRFDVVRKFDRHVSLGVGAHYCLGAALARLEGRVALQETLTRFPDWSVDHAATQRLHTSSVRGYKNVPITL